MFTLVKLILVVVNLSSFAISGTIHYLGSLEEGSNCGYNEKTASFFGTCQKINNCISALNEYKISQRVLQVCSFNNNSSESMVCCSLNDKEKSRDHSIGTSQNENNGIKRKFDDCCNQYLEFRRYTLIGSFGAVNGIDVNPREIPNMAAIGWTQGDGSIEYDCGGTIYNEKYILTAAHCVKDGNHPDVVRLGDINLISSNDDENVQEFKIVEIIKHPKYRSNSTHHDIALLKLNKSIRYNDFISPPCISNIEQKGGYFSAGYGQIGFAAMKSNKLLKVSLQKISLDDCNKSYDEKAHIEEKLVEGQLCAKGFGTGESEMDTCGGDSGSPFQYDFKHEVGDKIYDIPAIVGLVSFGIGCASGIPSVYTNLAHYMNWIESSVSNN